MSIVDDSDLLQLLRAIEQLEALCNGATRSAAGAALRSGSMTKPSIADARRIVGHVAPSLRKLHRKIIDLPCAYVGDEQAIVIDGRTHTAGQIKQHLFDLDRANTELRLEQDALMRKIAELQKENASLKGGGGIATEMTAGQATQEALYRDGVEHVGSYDPDARIEVDGLTYETTYADLITLSPEKLWARLSEEVMRDAKAAFLLGRAIPFAVEHHLAQARAHPASMAPEAVQPEVAPPEAVQPEVMLPEAEHSEAALAENEAVVWRFMAARWHLVKFLHDKGTDEQAIAEILSITVSDVGEIRSAGADGQDAAAHSCATRPDEAAAAPSLRMTALMNVDPDKQIVPCSGFDYPTTYGDLARLPVEKLWNRLVAGRLWPAPKAAFLAARALPFVRRVATRDQPADLA